MSTIITPFGRILVNLNKKECIKLVNIDKIKTLADSRGITQTYICGRIGKARQYLSVCKNKNVDIPDNLLGIIAEILDTTTDYLRDLTDDPSPIASPTAAADDLTEQEQELVGMFRSTTEQGRFRMIQAVMNIHDEEEKKPRESSQGAAG